MQQPQPQAQPQSLAVPVAPVMPVVPAVAPVANTPLIPLKVIYPSMVIVQALGFGFAYHYQADVAKLALVLVIASAVSQMFIDFVPSANPAKPVLSALARLIPIIVAIGALLTS